MLNWFQKNKYPDFWKEYLLHFKEKQPTALKDIRFVVFDTETTGLNIANDRILSIGAVAVKNNVIDIADSFEMYVKQDKFDASTVEIHGILKEGNIVKVDEEFAVKEFLKFIKNSVLVAHHAAFDIAMMNEALKRVGLPKLKNRSVDTGVIFKMTEFHKNGNMHYGLDELCKIFTIKQHDRHTASGDAYITALIFLKILSNLSKRRKVLIGDLFVSPERRGLL